MTVTYPNGIALKAFILTHEEREIRAVAPGYDDVLTFTRIRGRWLSEVGEAVTIKFAWQREGAPPIPSEDDCICPKDLAARLIQSLFGGSERNEVDSDTLFVFSPAGSRVAIHLSELRLN